MMNVNVKAISTKDGLVVAFSKHELAHMKNGGMTNLNLVSGGQRVKMMFMRDTTFKKQERQLQVLTQDTAEQEAELQQDIKGLADDLSE